MTTNAIERRTPVVVAAERAGRGGPALSRRGVLRVAFWAGVGAALAGGVATIVNLLYPRGVTGFGGPIVVPASAIPEPGQPPRAFPDGRFLLVNLAPGEGARVGSDADTPGGLMALWTRCPHLGCTVPWRQDLVFNDGSGRRGWFQCPCHGSTYTKAGVKVRGPATRSMDTMMVEVADGGIVVQTGVRREGDDANTERAVAWDSASAHAGQSAIVAPKGARAY